MNKRIIDLSDDITSTENHLDALRDEGYQVRNLGNYILLSKLTAEEQAWIDKFKEHQWEVWIEFKGFMVEMFCYTTKAGDREISKIITRDIDRTTICDMLSNLYEEVFTLK